MNAKYKATMAGVMIVGGVILALLFSREGQRGRLPGTSDSEPHTASGASGYYLAVPPLGALPVNASMVRADHEIPREIAAEPDAYEREQAIQSWVNTISTEDLPPEVASLASAELSELSHDLWLRLLRRWGDTDPEAPARWASGIANDGSRLAVEALNQVAIAWANSDLQHAVEWVSQWPEESQRQLGLVAVAYEGARRDPIAALQIASALPANQDTLNLVNYSTSQWATIDPVAAWQWTHEIADAATRESLRSHIVVSWAARDPATAAERVSEISPGRERDDAVVGIAQHWAQQNAEAARDWIGRSLGSSEAQNAALSAVAAIAQTLRSNH